MIDYKEQCEIFDKAWKLWGAELQMDILIEEMAELTQSIIKTRREGLVFSASVFEEIADVEICLAQIRLKICKIKGDYSPVEMQKQIKLQRLKERLERSQLHNKLKDITVGTAGANR
jgi:hypothetical protein